MKNIFLIFSATCLALFAVPAAAHGPDDEQGASSEAASAQAGIANEAQGNAAPQSAAGSTSAQEDGRSDEAHENDSGSILTKLHPATVHFPIALLLMAAATEAFAALRSADANGLYRAVNVMVWGGAIGAVVAAIFGWIHTGLWFGGGTTIQLHRWTGTSIAAISLGAAAISGATNRTALRFVLGFLTLAIFAQGYWGGELAHGPNHLGL